MSVTTSFTITDEADLNAAIRDIDLTGADSAQSLVYTFALENGFTLTSQIKAINLAAGDTLTIDGNSNTIDGAHSYDGLFVYAGSVAVDDLSIDDTRAVGGAGATDLFPGGGGAA